MAGISRKVHLEAQFEYGSIDRIAADLGIRFQVEPTNGSEPPEPIIPNAVWFTDPDGEAHVYVLSDEGRTNLITKLTGGIVVPVK